MPRLASFLGRHKLIEFFPMKSIRFVEQVTNEIIERRKANIDVRDDFIQSMIEHEAKNDAEQSKDEEKSPEEGKEWNGRLKKTLTVSERLSQAILFMVAGYETTATALEFIAYHIAMHQDVQDKLIEEIDQVLKKHVSEKSIVISLKSLRRQL